MVIAGLLWLGREGVWAGGFYRPCWRDLVLFWGETKGGLINEVQLA